MTETSITGKVVGIEHSRHRYVIQIIPNLASHSSAKAPDPECEQKITVGDVVELRCLPQRQVVD